ncbi:MAG: short-chain fatty acyl-CoA regulator family protein, partial [Pseudomonadota bacterium]
DLRAAVAHTDIDPLALAKTFGVSVACMMRRLASAADMQCGLVVADRAGSLLFRKAVPGFVIPRYGSACPRWPLFQALSQPGQVLYHRIQMAGRADAVFDCFATAEPMGPTTLNTAPLMEATMLIVPVASAAHGVGDRGTEMGAACRICSVGGCPGRREPSILSDGF